MRLLVAFLLMLAAPAFAQLRLQFVYNADANAYWGGSANANAAIAAAVAGANASLAASAITGTIATPASILQVEVPNALATDTYKQLIPTMLSTTIADIAQGNTADIIIAVTQHPFPNSSVGGTWKGDPSVDAVASVIVIDANVLMDGTSLLYWLGRQMGAKNQRTGGTNDESDGTAHGYWLKFGNSIADCELAQTLDALDISPVFGGTCTGWMTDATTPPSRECNAQQWCTSYANSTPPKQQFGCYAYGCAGWSGWTGVTSGSGSSRICTVTARDVFSILYTYVFPQGAGTTGTYGFTCPTRTRLNVFSNPSLLYRGQALGTVADNSVAAINTNFAAKANTRNLHRPDLVRATLGYVVKPQNCSSPPC